ncbi:J domain-containing protein [Paenibacillus sp. GSMTC-2017]|uniref:J domain-containing protein n=1 Tax=Paenibacillus sp. GSMTC-2017 TaxID=2794350 RepID=UPI0018D5CD71|nr:J domain-containing protein [Paenibacillus sp. GSMTC-2017]MBH5318265.1 J domain-containing protein [Paenibacillus sp. GSMTC-2017]
MDELKQAYKTMGLEEFATKDEVEKRYMTLLRRERTKTKHLEANNLTSSEQSEDQFKHITAAYRFILAHEDQKVMQEFNEKEYGKYKNMAGKAQKLDHFWRYYKLHTLGVVALIGIIIYAIVGYIDHREEQKYLASLPPVDVSTIFYGMFMQPEGETDLKAVSASMLKSFPEWKRIESSIIYVPGEDLNAYAYLQKAMVTLMSEVHDVILMDKKMFDWIGGQSALLDLEGQSELAPWLAGEQARKLTVEGDTQERIYGFDLSGTQLSKDLRLLKSDLIVGVHANANNPEKAIQFIKKYLETLPSQ